MKKLEGHTKGVNACGWSTFYKFVCSGGQDRRVILFNPFSQKPLATLLGHNAGVIEVAINDRENQIVSLSSDKCLKVNYSFVGLILLDASCKLYLSAIWLFFVDSSNSIAGKRNLF